MAPMKPFSQQMGVADKYAMDAARMAMSHPAMLDHADRPHVQFGSVAQFRVRDKILNCQAPVSLGLTLKSCRPPTHHPLKFKHEEPKSKTDLSILSGA